MCVNTQLQCEGEGERMSEELISKAEAIDAVRTYMADNEITDSDWHADGIAYDIKRLPSTQQWIPVSERLPEEGRQVLVCDDGGFIYTAEYETLSDGEWQWYESVEYRRMDDVVAWMPLPKPWKGEKDETDRR